MKKKKKTILFSILYIVVIFTFAIFKLSDTKTFTTKSIAKIFKDPVEVHYIDRIDINFDTTKTRLSPAYTYLESMHLFEYNWTYPEGVHYHSGGNVYFAYCPTSSPCELNETEYINTGEEYFMTVKGEKYHWVEFEVEANECEGYDAICEYDFKDDEEYLNSIDVWVNGEKIDNAVVTGFNDYWHLVRVYIPLDTYKGALVKSVTINSDSNYIERGTSKTLTANVEYYGEEASHVVWSIDENESDNTTINQSGVLSVALDEESNYITVIATSTFDNTVYDLKTINIIDEPLSIDNVTFREATDTVVYGGTYTFYARANGTANPDVSWSITGANKAGTTIDSEGTLTVAADETATSVIVTATSVFDNTKKASLTITLRDTEYVSKIEINYDTDKVIFSTKTTYSDVRRILERNWSTPEGVGYDEGDHDVWFNYCDTLERCTDDMNTININDNMVNKYTYAIFEIFAKPSEEGDSLNPEYDFDPENIENIEIWVNGVKRDDAFAYGYNDYWRMVHIYVPITINNDKLAQEFEFYNNEYTSYYESEPFTNEIKSYNRIGDGEITYASSDTDIATVDNEGYVTVKKIGTCTITATAAETDDYNEFSNSYTLIVKPKNIYPTIDGYDYYHDYTGSQITPEVTVSYNEIELVKDVDYTVSYDENINNGYGHIYVNPVEGSNYTFSERSISIYINQKSIQKSDITISPSSVYYDGTSKEVTVSVTVDGRLLTVDTDYTVGYSSNTAVGTAYVYITGINNYSGSQYLTFEIVEPPEYEKGDMNKDGVIGLQDVINLLKKYLGIEDITDEDIEIGDMNEDGNIGLQDVILLLKVYLGII